MHRSHLYLSSERRNFPVPIPHNNKKERKRKERSIKQKENYIKYKVRGLYIEEREGGRIEREREMERDRERERERGDGQGFYCCFSSVGCFEDGLERMSETDSFSLERMRW